MVSINSVIPKYTAGDGTPCTKEEEKLIDSLQRLARKWTKDGKDLMLFSWAGTLCVVKKSAINDDMFEQGVVTRIFGITNDGGDPDNTY